jgi:hypothetical protein
MSFEQTNTMIDYARLYDMSQAEINLFYKKDEEELIEMIEGTFSKEIGTLRSLLVSIRKRKTDIKSLRALLENPVEYFENLMENIYSESGSNIKSLKVTTKKVKSILDTLEHTLSEIKSENLQESPIGKVFEEQIDFMKNRLEYYETAMERYQSYVEYSRENKALKKKSPEEFSTKATEYCTELAKVLDFEEVALKADEETYRAKLEEWREGRYMFQDKYEKQIMKSME